MSHGLTQFFTTHPAGSTSSAGSCTLGLSPSSSSLLPCRRRWRRGRRGTASFLQGQLVWILTDLGYHDLWMVGWDGGLLVVQELLESFSPSRNPTYLMSMPSTPERAIMRFARSAMRTGLPMSKTKISPALPIVPASNTDLQASGMSMKKRMMSDGWRWSDRPSLSALEDWNNWTVACPRRCRILGNKLGDTLYLAIYNRLVQRLTVDLADSLAASHHVGWVYCLVRRDHHELLRAVLHCHVGYHARTIYYSVLPRLDCPPSSAHACRQLHGIHQVLDGRLGEDALHTGGIGDAGYDGFAWDICIVLVHEEADIVHWGLSLINENQTLWLIDGNLLHHLGTDTAGCSRNQNGATARSFPIAFISTSILSRGRRSSISPHHHPMTEVWLAVPALCLRHHHNLDAFCSKLVYHILLLQNSSVTRGLTKRVLTFSLCMIPINASSYEIDFASQQESTFYVCFWRSKPFHYILRWMIITHGLCQGDTAFSYTEDENRSLGVGWKTGVVHILH